MKKKRLIGRQTDINYLNNDKIKKFLRLALISEAFAF